MSVEVKVPAVGESISSGVVSVWHKKSGEQVNCGDPLFTLETDKVSTEINAERDGILQTRVAEGAEVKIGDVVAVITDRARGAAKPVTEKREVAKQGSSKEESDVMSPAVRRVVTEGNLDPGKIAGTGKGGRLTKGDALAATKGREHDAGAAVAPAAAGPSNAKADSQSAPTEELEKPAVQANERFSRKKMSPLRRKIAAQMVMA